MMTATRFSEERLSYAEVAAIVGVKAQTVRRWVSEEKHGFPRGIKTGKRRHFIRSEIDAWLEAGRNRV
jgi:excisionase family DNA binding protein